MKLNLWQLLISILLMTNNIAAAQFIGDPLPPGHPVLNSAWIGREIGISTSVQVALMYVAIDRTGHYTAYAYSRNQHMYGLYRGEPWTGEIRLVSGNILVAWNDGVIGEHGYLLAFDNRWQMAQATLFSKTTTTIENSIWTRTTANVAPIVQLLDQFKCP